jgi:hypothetical protein
VTYTNREQTQAARSADVRLVTAKVSGAPPVYRPNFAVHANSLISQRVPPVYAAQTAGIQPHVSRSPNVPAGPLAPPAYRVTPPVVRQVVTTIMPSASFPVRAFPPAYLQAPPVLPTFPSPGPELRRHAPTLQMMEDPGRYGASSSRRWDRGEDDDRRDRRRSRSRSCTPEPEHTYPDLYEPEEGTVRARAIVRYKLRDEDTERTYTTEEYVSGKLKRGKRWSGPEAWEGRDTDAEAKVYQEILDFFRGKDVAEGRINLHSTQGPCNSCRQLRWEVERRLGVRVNTLSDKTSYIQDIKNPHLQGSYRREWGHPYLRYGHQRSNRVRERDSRYHSFETPHYLASPRPRSRSASPSPPPRLTLPPRREVQAVRRTPLTSVRTGSTITGTVRELTDRYDVDDALPTTMFSDSEYSWGRVRWRCTGVTMNSAGQDVVALLRL